MPQRADRAAVGGTHEEHFPPLVRRQAGGDSEQGPLGVHATGGIERMSPRCQICVPFATSYAVSGQSV